MFEIATYSVLLVLVSIMVITGILKESGVMERICGSILSKIKNQKVFLCVASMLSGILPIHNRVIVTSGFLDSITEKTKDNKILGIVSYLSTHHYYLWSPIEKSVIISMGILGVSYLGYLKLMAVPIIAGIALTTGLLIYALRGKDIRILQSDTKAGKMDWVNFGLFVGIIGAALAHIPMWISFSALAVYLASYYKMGVKKLNEFIDWKMLSIVALIVAAGAYIKSHTAYFYALVDGMLGAPMLTVMVVAFLCAFALGSSSRYATIAASMTSMFGIQFFPLFYLSEYAGYLISPAHKCTVIGNQYFKTPLLKYAGYIGAYALALIAIGALMVL